MTVILSVGLVSCGKDGSIGPQGPMGEQGEQGAAGKDGTAVLNGSADPTTDQGKVGDFYINTNSYVLFGPKTNSGWGNGESILGVKGDKGDKGEQGDKGEADYVILSGDVNPVNNVGKQGDFYLNRATKTLFYRGPLTPGSPWIEVAKLANTIQFTKEGVVLGATPLMVHLNDLPWDIFEKSMVNVYVQLTGGYWYSLPGTIAGDNEYFTVHFIQDTGLRSLILRINSVSETPHTYNATIRIVVTEAHEFHTISKHVDFNNYHEVSQYFGLKH